MRVAIYTRISTDETNQPFSLEAQETKLRAYVTSQEDWRIVGKPFTDKASGATLERKHLQRMLAAARAGRFDVLLVYRVDRISRSIRGLVEIIDELDKAGVTFRSATEPFDTSTPAGRMMVQMLGVFAEFERAMIIDRVINGLERKAARGEWCNGTRPCGYLIDPDTHHLIVHDPEVPIVTQIFDCYTRKHMGAKAIGTMLAKRGLRTVAGNPWNHVAVLTVLRNRVYLGEIFYRGKTHVGTDKRFHPPLIDPDTFDAAQKLLAERGEAYPRKAITATDYTLAGLITCTRCAKKFVGAAAHGRNRRYRYYVCYTRHRYGTNACPAERIPADPLEHAMLKALQATYADTSIVDDALSALAARSGELHHQDKDELTTLAAKIKTTEDAIERYLHAFEAKTMDEAICGRRVQKLAIELTQLQDREAELRHTLADDPEPPMPEDINELRDHIADVIHNGDERSRKALLQALTWEIKITGRHKVKPTFVVPLKDHKDLPNRVRPRSGSVEPRGFEPLTPGLQSQCSAN
jgi:site-specific DNA recombinase